MNGFQTAWCTANVLDWRSCWTICRFSCRDYIGSLNTTVCGQGLLFYTVAKESSLGTYSYQNAHFAHHIPELWMNLECELLYIRCKAQLFWTVFGWGEEEKGMCIIDSCLRVRAYTLGLFFFLFNKQVFRLPHLFLLIHFPNIYKSVIPKWHYSSKWFCVKVSIQF